MRIGLNLLHAQPGIGGAWNYIARLVETLGGEDDPNTYVCFVTKRSADIVPVHKRNMEVVLVDIDPVSRWRRVLYENTVLPFQIKRHGVEIVHWFAATQALCSGSCNVVSFHDLQVFENSNLFSSVKQLYLRKMMAFAAKKANLLLPVSQTTAQQLHSILSVPEHRMLTIRVVVGEQFRRASDRDIAELRAKYDLPDFFWLYVAHFYPHKNHLRLLEAYHALKRAGARPWPLILRGDELDAWPETVRQVEQLGLVEDIFFLPRLLEAEVPVLYSATTAVVFPSLYEGGAIPVVEALACGCPVIASDLPLLREYESGMDTYFDPYSVDAIQNAIATFQQNYDRSDRMMQHRSWDAREHSPTYVAAQLRKAYMTAAGLIW